MIQQWIGEEIRVHVYALGGCRSTKSTSDSSCTVSVNLSSGCPVVVSCFIGIGRLLL